MEKRDVLKINRQFLLLTRQLAREGRAAEIMTGLPRAVIEKVASLDMDEIDELAETVPVSLYTQIPRFEPHRSLGGAVFAGFPPVHYSHTRSSPAGSWYCSEPSWRE